MFHTTILFLRDVSFLAAVATSPASPVRLVPKLAGFVRRSLCPFGLVALAAVAPVPVAADPAVVPAAVVVLAVAAADPAAGPGSVAVAAVVAAATSA